MEFTATTKRISS